LYCVEGVAAARDLQLQPVHQLANQLAGERIARFRQVIDRLPAAERRDALRAAWTRALGYEPAAQAVRTGGNLPLPSAAPGPVRVVKLVRGTDRLPVPLILLIPQQVPQQGCPCVVGVAEAGKAGFLAHRSAQLAELLRQGVAVCLPDLPGGGETSPGTYRGRRGPSTGISSSRLMLGGTVVGDRLRDLLSLVAWLRTLDEIDDDRMALWGDSFAAVNTPESNVAVPLGIDGEPAQAEPIGALLSLLAPLFDPRLDAALARGGLVSLRSVLDSPFVLVPHDVIIPEALTAGDLPDIAAALDTIPIRVEGLVDGTNRRPAPSSVERDWQHVAERGERVQVTSEATNDYIAWLVAALARERAF
jgi:hypothetical protein